MKRLVFYCFIAFFSSNLIAQETGIKSLHQVGLASQSQQQSSQIAANTYKKTIFQSFWWDYKNDNYPNSWANYLTELAPRLKSMGFDAIWIPPTAKNEGGTNGVGYAPFDHYDLGDKFQKATTKTRVGTKDELLRMVAVMHANGIEVIQDIVPNHVIGAGSDTGGGGQDPAAPVTACTDLWKNFRYVSYSTPATDQTASDYLNRTGRFPKNHQNFHPNVGHSCTSGLCDSNIDAWCWQGFGPDVCYHDDATGLSSNAIYNPIQNTYSPYGNGGTGTGNGYMRKHYREWLLWSKKQIGFDGVRIDAVKHFPEAACEDFLYNLQHMAGWANGDDKMFAVGEWVGGNAALNTWVTDVSNRSGAFDFNLRAFDATGGINSMIGGNGGFDMGSLPGAQQTNRYIDLNGDRIHRTVPFVNNHDTYRPTLSSVGNVTGWNTGDELSPHVDIREPRMIAAYAVVLAMDGNPQIFFEDLFNITNTSKRFGHLPTSTTDLPANSDIANIILAHGALDFKGGDYKVPSNVASFYNTVTTSNNNDDLLAIERSGKAIILATDNWTTDQNAWMDTDFPQGTVLKDYSGGYSTTSTVLGPDPSCSGTCPNRVNLSCRAVGYPSFAYSTSYADHGAQYHGYAIWAPSGQTLSNYANAAIPTTQEWEMENDLGDSHCSSLRQGGRTPNNSPNARVVGKIYAQANSTVSYEVTLGTVGTDLTFELYDLSGNLLHSVHGSSATLAGSYSNSSQRWLTMKVRNTSAMTSGQKCRVKMTYNAPTSVVTSTNTPDNKVSIWTSNGGSSIWSDCKNWENGLIPACTDTVIVPHNVAFFPTLDACYTGVFINNGSLTLKPKAFLKGAYNTSTGQMNDALRAANLLPTTSPYGDGASCVAAVFTATGANAIVDWVKVELRDKTTPTTIITSQSAFIQRDGDIVGLDGISPLYIKNTSVESYYIALRHRNHLAVMSQNSLPLTNRIVSHDFSSAASYGSNAQQDLGSGVKAMWVGDGNQDGKIIYQGSSADITPITIEVYSNPFNINFEASFPVSGYFSGDYNMDGIVIYQGAGADITPITSSVYSNPLNTNFEASFPVLQQLP